MKPSILAIIIAILLVPVVALVISNRKTPTVEPTPTPSATASSLVDPADALSAKKVLLSTTKGDITINLFPSEAPHTVKNFVTLGKRGYYNNLIFHRVIKSFVIQTGDPNGDGSGGESIYGKTFPGEINSHKFAQGTVGMARTNQPDTYGSQFFIVTQTEQPNLDGQYTVFGQIDPASQSVVDAIAGVPTDSSDKPTEDIHVTAFKILE